MQLRALYENNPRFWEKQERWQYFLERPVAEDVARRLRELSEAGRVPQAEPDADGGAAEQAARDAGGSGAEAPPAPAADGADDDIEELEPADNGDTGTASNFGGTYDRYRTLKREERVGLLQRTTGRLNELAARDHADQEEVAEALVEATQDATMVNRATLLEALRIGNEEAKAYTQQMVVETHRMVKSTIQLVESDVYNDDLVRAVVEKSNGTVVQHMTRVFLSGLEFLLYYNRQVMTRGIANRIRIRFRRDYKSYYRQLLPHLHEDYVSLEHVFLGGMKALSEVEINKFATGFLVHDVGKAEDIEYHEGDKGYDRETVERHVKIGYKAVMEKTNYPREAGLITGYHHEYYGHPNGYGYFREFLDNYKRANPEASQDYIMAYTMEPLIDYEVLAYFPAKVLEIVDVFDSLTDPNRIYRSPMSPDEAIAMIHQQFVVEHLKVDPILFDLFVDFYRETRQKAL